MTREKELEELILYHKKLYYAGEPEISDTEFDLLEDELRSINPENPSLFVVGTLDAGKVLHDPLMLSCKKATSLTDVMKWVSDIENRGIFVGHKVDGLSLSLIYEGGKLIQAATRGNGQYGDDTTVNIMFVEQIPKTIPIKERINVRGELYMSISEFNRIKSSISTKSYTSPRNLATGTLKQKDFNVIKSRELLFKAWDLVGLDGSHTIQDLRKYLVTWGFDAADLYLIENPSHETVQKAYDEIAEKREDYDFELDGVLFKYNENQDRANAGFTDHHPKWQIAWKFESRGTETILEDIYWQVGRTGVLTPVAKVKPVFLSGAEISQATLHNVEYIEGLSISPGDTVSIERAGDVIPKITEVVAKGPNSINLPTKCPSCDSVLKREGVNLVCTGNDCRDREVQAILYWVAIVEIKGLGQKSVEKLYDNHMVTHFADLYSNNLTEYDLVDQLGKNGSKIFKGINKSRDLPFNIFLAGLGISNLGKKTGKILTSNFDSFENLQKTSISRLNEIEGISDIIAHDILNGVNDPNLGERVLLNNVTLVYPKRKKIIRARTQLEAFFSDGEIEEETGIGRGRKIYITGSVEGYTKKSLTAMVEDLDFVWSSSVSSKLGMLVCGNNPGQTKIDKALKLGVKILTWSEFEKMIN